jgi:methylated-DNA-[protein]-cysteine S-methyltransferase
MTAIDATRSYSRITMPSPIGALTVVATSDAIVAIRWDESDVGLRGPITDVRSGEHPLLDDTVRQLTEYFAGDRTEFDLPLAPAGSEFQRAAWAALRKIPFGETISYGEQARRLGDRNKSRAVGAANGKNPIPIVVPCHRVVGSNGHLTGFGGGLEVKAWLLDHELAVRTRSPAVGDATMS